LEPSLLHGAEVTRAYAGLLGNIADLKADCHPLFPQDLADVLHDCPPVTVPGNGWQFIARGFLIAGVTKLYHEYDGKSTKNLNFMEKAFILIFFYHRLGYILVLPTILIA
jgi:hypothetical protein